MFFNHLNWNPSQPILYRLYMIIKYGNVGNKIDPICHQHLQFVNKIYWHKFIRHQYQCHPWNYLGWISNQKIVFSKFLSNFGISSASKISSKNRKILFRFWDTWPWIFFFGQFIENNKLKINKNWFGSTSHEIDFSRIKVESHP